MTSKNTSAPYFGSFYCIWLTPQESPRKRMYCRLLVLFRQQAEFSPYSDKIAGCWATDCG